MNVTRRAQFDAYLDELRQALIKMSERVEKSIENSVKSLKNMDTELAKSVVEEDIEINKMEENIEDIGARIIATQQPVAKDLRRIIIAFRMANDLERMADLAVDIAKVTLRIENEGLIKPLVDIPRMAEIVQQMISDSIKAYVEEDIQLAYKMAQMDDEVDHLHSQILRELFAYIAEKNQNVNQALQLCFVSRYLERVADHATNIGESVVYLVQGHRPDLND
ncbi:phosphate transport system regulatory protein PhoU [Insulibacter thermoxylanivorax]|uniref:Phosphate-specific transport system accessory protein PhoU n=1 Tax=Insulibacter thermoxylanivorax TaxID=2749268 RepID=A0A916QGH2_9BACL|nr:phosphate transport system regulatory protein PhoU [Insulibacter thermoxylanivorax]